MSIKEPQKVVADYVERAKVESAEVTIKVEKLRAFLFTPVFGATPHIEQILLREQYHAMDTYLRLLNTRIALYDL